MWKPTSIIPSIPMNSTSLIAHPVLSSLSCPTPKSTVSVSSVYLRPLSSPSRSAARLQGPSLAGATDQREAVERLRGSVLEQLLFKLTPRVRTFGLRGSGLLTDLGVARV